MKTSRLLTFLLLLTAGIARVEAQDNPAPTPAAEPAQTEMQKWIATTDAQWQAAFNRDVVDAHAAELKKLVAQYAVSLETALTKAGAAGDLDGALALRNEQKRFTETNVFPEQDDAADAASVKQIRGATRVQLVRVEKENAIRTKALHAKYDAVLAQVQTQLTQHKRLDDALLVKTKREEVAAVWLAAVPAPAPAPARPVAAPAVTPVATNPPPVLTPTFLVHPGIGESLAQTTRRFGAWPKQDNSRLPGTERYRYDKDTRVAEVMILNGKVVMVVLHRKSQVISDSNLKEVMKANGEGHGWAFDKKTNEWVRGDHKIKVFREPGHGDVLFMQDIAAVKEIEKNDKGK